MKVRSVFIHPNDGEIPQQIKTQKIEYNYYERPSFFTDDEEEDEDEISIDDEISPDSSQAAQCCVYFKPRKADVTSEINEEDCANENITIATDSNGTNKEKALDDFTQGLNENIEEEKESNINKDYNKLVMHLPNMSQKIKASSGLFNFEIKQSKSPPQMQPLMKKTTILSTISGKLKKKSPYAIQGWQERFCEVRGKKFLYYDSKNSEKLLGCIDFDLVSVNLEGIKDKKFKQIQKYNPLYRSNRICVHGSKKLFLFKARDNTERENWITALKENIAKSLGATQILSLTSKIPKFWKVERICQSQFLLKADTLDILLFRTKNVGSKIQRSITRSHYDHVALLLRYNDGEIVFLEATGKEGVGLCRWKTFMKNKWHLHYSKIVYRHLEIDRSETVITDVEKFVKNVLGKKYKISASKLLRKKSRTIDSNDPDQQNTFFCSELVAACYKKLKLLPKEISCSTYWPGNFSYEKKLPLLPGAKLGPELVIDFSLQII